MSLIAVSATVSSVARDSPALARKEIKRSALLAECGVQPLRVARVALEIFSSVDASVAKN